MADLYIPYKPFPIHLPLHLSRVREKCAMGSVGSGKTLALCGEAIRWAHDVPGRKLMICRDTVPSLRDSTEDEFISLLATPPDDEDADETPVTLWEIIEQERLLKRSGGHVDHFYFPNGSQVMFRSLDKWTKIMSYNLSFIGVDEANEIDFDTYVNLVSRLRQRHPTAMARRQGVRWGPVEKESQEIVLATNSHGHNWIWENFINHPTPDRRLFKSTSFDNPTLYREDGSFSAYLENLLSMPQIWVRRFVMGDTDTFAGQILDYDPSENVYQHFEPPAHWERGMGFDWGLRNPHAAVWFAREPGTAKWYIYREWQSYDSTIPEAREMYVTMNVQQVANKIKELERGEDVKWRAADPMIWRRHPTHVEETKTIASWFDDHGLHFQRGAKDYETRISALNNGISRRSVVVSSACPMVQVAFQQYQWEDLKVTNDDKDPAEKPLKKNDHLVDAAQYFMTLWAGNAPAADAQRPITADEHIRKLVRTQVKKHHKRATMSKRGIKR